VLSGRLAPAERMTSGRFLSLEFRDRGNTVEMRGVRGGEDASA